MPPAGREREAAERAGVSRFMSKPFSNADVLASVRALAVDRLGRTVHR